MYPFIQQQFNFQLSGEYCMCFQYYSNINSNNATQEAVNAAILNQADIIEKGKTITGLDCKYVGLNGSPYTGTFKWKRWSMQYVNFDSQL